MRCLATCRSSKTARNRDTTQADADSVIDLSWARIYLKHKLRLEKHVAFVE
jgi:hypothetical protein